MRLHLQDETQCVSLLPRSCRALAAPALRKHMCGGSKPPPYERKFRGKKFSRTETGHSPKKITNVILFPFARIIKCVQTNRSVCRSRQTRCRKNTNGIFSTGLARRNAMPAFALREKISRKKFSRTETGINAFAFIRARRNAMRFALVAPALREKISTKKFSRTETGHSPKQKSRM